VRSAGHVDPYEGDLSVDKDAFNKDYMCEIAFIRGLHRRLIPSCSKKISFFMT